MVHREKWRLALGLLDTLAEWRLKAPVVVADTGYGVSTPFRLGLEERGLSYVLALNGKEVAHPEDVERHQPAYGGLGPPTFPRHRTPPRAVSVLAAEAGAERFTEDVRQAITLAVRVGSRRLVPEAGYRPTRDRRPAPTGRAGKWARGARNIARICIRERARRRRKAERTG